MPIRLLKLYSLPNMAHEKTSRDEKKDIEVVENIASPEEIEFKKKEIRVVAKLDLYLAPILVVLQLISFLDRGNIGYAATQGMPEDIGLKGTQLNV